MIDDHVEIFTHRDFTITLYHDEMAAPPYNNYVLDELFIVANHPEFSIGEISDINPHHNKEIPLYAYIHSGIQLSIDNTVYPFTDEYDTCEIGVVVIPSNWTEEQIEKNVSVKLAEWNMWLNGDVYGYVIRDPHGHEDSCWGFCGDVNGEDGALTVARQQVDDLYVNGSDFLELPDDNTQLSFNF